MVVEKAEGGERKPRQKEVWVFASILTERAPSSRSWNYPAAADPSPRSAPSNRRGSPGSKVATGTGLRARGVGAVPATHKFLPPTLGVLGGFASTCVHWGVLFLRAFFFFVGGGSFEVKTAFWSPGTGFEGYPVGTGMAVPQVGNCCSNCRK